MAKWTIFLLIVGRFICVDPGEAHARSQQRTHDGLCVSCRTLKLPTNEFGFAEVPLGVPVQSWTSVDIDHDGIWEFAIALAASPPQVGIFSPMTLEWVFGPFEVNVNDDNWGVVDVDDDGELEIAYLDGNSVRLFDPITGHSTMLWSHERHPSDVQFWGSDASGQPQVGWLLPGSSDCGDACTSHYWEWSVFDLKTGTAVGLGGFGTPGGARVIPGFPSSRERCLIVFASYNRLTQRPWSGSQYYYQRLRLISDQWGVLRDIDLPYYRYPIPGSNPPLAMWTLHQATLGPCDGSAEPSLVWFSTADPSSHFGPVPDYFGAYNNSGGNVWSACNGCSFQNSPFSGMAVFDYNYDGMIDLVLPLESDMGWELRDLYTGAVTDTVIGLPPAEIGVAALFQAGQSNLYYFYDVSLFIYNPEPSIGSIEDPETLQLYADPVAVSAHPNPFNSAVTLTWSGTASSLTIFNVLGQAVTEMALDGKSSVTWDGCDSQSHECPSGIYIAQVASRDFTASTKIVLLR